MRIYHDNGKIIAEMEVQTAEALRKALEQINVYEQKSVELERFYEKLYYQTLN